jgi:hypothetical protein
MNKMKKRLSGVALMSVLALGVIFIPGSAVQAQYRDDDDDRYDHRYDRHGNRGYWPRERTRDYAFAFGYFIAYPEGRQNSYRDRRFDHDDLHQYRNDTNGFLSWMGDRNTYRTSYRRGFEFGFREGRDGRNCRFGRREVERLLGDSLRNVYGRDYRDRYDDSYGRYNRDQIIRIAQQNGYRDGYRHGQHCRNQQARYDYESLDEYRDGMRGFRLEYRDRELYRRVYREAYKRGYDDGYRRTGGGWRW